MKISLRRIQHKFMTRNPSLRYQTFEGNNSLEKHFQSFSNKRKVKIISNLSAM